MVSNGRNERSTDTQCYQSSLDDRHNLTEHSPSRRKRIVFTNYKDFRFEITYFFLELFKDIFIGSTFTVLDKKDLSSIVLCVFQFCFRNLLSVLWLSSMFFVGLWFVLERLSVVEGLLFRRQWLLSITGKQSSTYSLKHSQPDTKVDEAAENEFNILFSSLHINIISFVSMGCEVTSVYNDQILGKMGYPKIIVDDLSKREYRSKQYLTDSKCKIEMVNIQGFTQSFAISKLTTTVIKGKEYFVYTAGRFLVVCDSVSYKKNIVSSNDLITAFDLREKFCLTGVYGGYLTLWDLQFLQKKIQVQLPEGSFSISSVGLTSKYLFATDNSSPNNIAFCYDVKTGKMRGYTKIMTIQPLLKAISVGSNKIAIASGDGIWFIQQSVNPIDNLTATRGMFGQYPKTSMICLQQADNYVITGGVDGYIYAWNIEKMRCCKALKVHDSQISAIAVNSNKVIISGFNGRTKVYTFKVTKIQKKNYLVELDQQKKAQQEDTELITFVLIDTFDKQGKVMSIAVLSLNPDMYYCQTREGMFFQKQLPLMSMASKGTVKMIENEQISRFAGDSRYILNGEKIYSIYRNEDKILFMDVHELKLDHLQLAEQRIIKLKESAESNYFSFSPKVNELIYFTKSNKLLVTQSYGKIGEALSNVNQSNFGQNTHEIATIQNEKIVYLDIIETSAKIFAIVTTNQTVFIFEREGTKTYTQIAAKKYEKKIPSPIIKDEQTFIFDQTSEKWKHHSETWHSQSQQRINQLKILHNGEIHSKDSRWSDKRLTLGEGFLIFHK